MNHEDSNMKEQQAPVSNYVLPILRRKIAIDCLYYDELGKEALKIFSKRGRVVCDRRSYDKSFSHGTNSRLWGMYHSLLLTQPGCLKLVTGERQ
jgi:hypothetical protein